MINGDIYFFISVLLLVEVPLLDGNSILSVALTSLQKPSFIFLSLTLVFNTDEQERVFVDMEILTEIGGNFDGD